ncbi:SMP-30/gluconolactonase/LRE family protein [Rhodanobacter sp. DHB23]|uniref:SMP-30/gluconolactonase/LRE family protein n=1 Tax=Rhodanobacter sp. DHB23 TaxID=2775923 RepID=UPI001782F2AB|nr:SMP-30/gluconolactonase/LRE family protein [Rhodanobacter sp. DHB23]MBD8872757.1 SMP-30/gluconolactonase/LRE family protein [Rhodanobacter sp. DHB23]
MSAPAQAAMQAVLEARNTLGEGITWCGRAQALYWTDIHASTLWRYTPSSGEARHWQLPERLASFALCEADGWLLLALASRLAFFRLEDGALHTLHEVEPQLPTRCNDGACDRQGRFVFGTLHEPADGGAKQPIGGFWRLDADLALERLPLEGVAISNSLAFSPDGGTLYYCDSLARTIRCCDYGDTLGDTRLFADLRDTAGEPDGSCVDVDGGLWNAQWGLGRVVRYRADGSVDRILPLAASQPTRPAFGGAALDTLYVTSARDGLDADVLAGEPLAGALFAAQVGRRGLPERRFAGRPPVGDTP